MKEHPQGAINEKLTFVYDVTTVVGKQDGPVSKSGELHRRFILKVVLAVIVNMAVLCCFFPIHSDSGFLIYLS